MALTPDKEVQLVALLAPNAQPVIDFVNAELAAVQQGQFTQADIDMAVAAAVAGLFTVEQKDAAILEAVNAFKVQVNAQLDALVDGQEEELKAALHALIA